MSRKPETKVLHSPAFGNLMRKSENFSSLRLPYIFLLNHWYNQLWNSIMFYSRDQAGDSCFLLQWKRRRKIEATRMREIKCENRAMGIEDSSVLLCGRKKKKNPRQSKKDSFTISSYRNILKELSLLTALLCVFSFICIVLPRGAFAFEIEGFGFHKNMFMRRAKTFLLVVDVTLRLRWCRAVPRKVLLWNLLSSLATWALYALFKLSSCNITDWHPE